MKDRFAPPRKVKADIDRASFHASLASTDLEQAIGQLGKRLPGLRRKLRKLSLDLMGNGSYLARLSMIGR